MNTSDHFHLFMDMYESAKYSNMQIIVNNSVLSKYLHNRFYIFIHFQRDSGSFKITTAKYKIVMVKFEFEKYVKNIENSQKQNLPKKVLVYLLHRVSKRDEIKIKMLKYIGMLFIYSFSLNKFYIFIYKKSVFQINNNICLSCSEI